MTRSVAYARAYRVSYIANHLWRRSFMESCATGAHLVLKALSRWKFVWTICYYYFVLLTYYFDISMKNKSTFRDSTSCSVSLEPPKVGSSCTNLWTDLGSKIPQIGKYGKLLLNPGLALLLIKHPSVNWSYIICHNLSYRLFYSTSMAYSNSGTSPVIITARLMSYHGAHYKQALQLAVIFKWQGH